MPPRVDGRATRLVACLLLTALLGLLGSAWLAERPLARFRGAANDVLFPRGELDPSVLVVAIDRRSLEAVGVGWPWPRSVLAELVDVLDEGGAAVVVLDLLFAEPSADDERLAAAMERNGAVVVVAAPLEVGPLDPQRPLRSSVMVEPVEELAGAAAVVAVSVVLPDRADGVVRAQPLVLEDADRRIMPSPALAALMITEDDGSPPVLRPSAVQVGDRLVPTEGHFRLRISWPAGLEGPLATPTAAPSWVSAVDLLEGRVDPEAIAGRAVFVGATDPSLGDRHPTPIAEAAGTAGVAQHAAVHHTLTSRQFLVPASATESLLWLLAAVLLVVIATQFLPLGVAGAVDVAVFLAVVVGVHVRSELGVLVDVVDPVVAAALAVPLSGGIRYLGEARLRRRVSRLFSQYVPEPVAEQLVRDGSAAGTQAQRTVVTLLFCDLRGFTPMAARLDPNMVREILSAYYAYATERVHARDGTLVQYVGDEVFAVFGAPIARADHAERALATATALQADRVELDRELDRLGAPRVAFGVAVHSGEVVAAHAGSPRRRQYVIVGDPVNVASRLCGQASAGELIVSADALAHDGVEPVAGEWFEPDLKGVDRRLRARRLSVPASVRSAGDGRAP